MKCNTTAVKTKKFKNKKIMPTTTSGNYVDCLTNRKFSLQKTNVGKSAIASVHAGIA